MIFPARNDSMIVAAAPAAATTASCSPPGCGSSSIDAGLLHTKTLTMDGEVTLIGSANMDRRSFDLNYENNILLFDAGLTAAMRRGRKSYLADCRQVSAAEVAAWGARRLWNNALAIVGPVL